MHSIPILEPNLQLIKNIFLIFRNLLASSTILVIRTYFQNCGSLKKQKKLLCVMIDERVSVLILIRGVVCMPSCQLTPFTPCSHFNSTQSINCPHIARATSTPLPVTSWCSCSWFAIEVLLTSPGSVRTFVLSPFHSDASS